MPYRAKDILFYLLSKSENWNVKVADIRQNLQLTTHTIRQSLRWLQEAGYAGWVRLKSGHVIWTIFSEPQKKGCSPEPIPKVVSPHVVKQTVYKINTVQKERNKTTHIDPKAPEKEVIENIVVVSLDIEEQELIFPPQVKDTKALKAVLKNKLDKKLIEKQPTITQDVLFALAWSMTNSAVHNPAGLLTQLCKAANAGTFTNPATKQAAGASITNQLSIDKTNQTLDAYRAIKPSRPSDIIQSLRSALRATT